MTHIWYIGENILRVGQMLFEISTKNYRFADRMFIRKIESKIKKQKWN